MKTIGVILVIIGVIVGFIGIRASFVIHANNAGVGDKALLQNDLPSIIAGLLGCVVLLIGYIIVMRPREKRQI